AQATRSGSGYARLHCFLRSGASGNGNPYSKRRGTVPCNQRRGASEACAIWSRLSASHQQTRVRRATMKPLERCRLYTFVDMAYLHGRKAVEVARQLCSGGADVIQLRAKEAEKEVVRKMGADLLAVTSGAGVWLVINDYPDVALEIGAPASHLGQEDFFDAGFTRVSALKDTLGAGSVRIGLSTHSPEQAHRALAAGPDYV